MSEKTEKDTILKRHRLFIMWPVVVNFVSLEKELSKGLFDRVIVRYNRAARNFVSLDIQYVQGSQARIPSKNRSIIAGSLQWVVA